MFTSDAKCVVLSAEIDRVVAAVRAAQTLCLLEHELWYRRPHFARRRVLALARCCLFQILLCALQVRGAPSLM